MKVEFVGVSNRVSSIEINTEECLQIFKDCLKGRGFIVEDGMTIRIVPRYFIYREQGHKLEICRHEENFRGMRPKK